MREDPRRAIVQVIARLGRETQLHLDERYRHFRFTDGVTIVASVLLVILAVFNVYYVLILYQSFNRGIVTNMDSMYQHLKTIDDNMQTITGEMEALDQHIHHMESIHGHMTTLSAIMPGIRGNMHSISQDMVGIEHNMNLVGQGMGVIDQRIHLMTGAVAIMRQNVRQIAYPFGPMNSFLP